MMALLCVSIFVHDLPQTLRDIARATEGGADMVELRIDRMTDPAAVRQLAEKCILPAIVTCRARWEGGQCDLSDEKRFKLLAAACHGHVRYLDIEFATARAGDDLPVGRPIITSSHDFLGRPERLHNLLLEMDCGPGAVSKIAWTARSVRDCIEAFEILQHRTRPTIALCMGEAGLPSRILASKFGGFLTFASLDADSATASGQVPLTDMKRLYHWDRIGQNTKVYGVVGQPIMHSMSPAIHNSAFDAVGHDGVYLPLPVESGYESFKAFMETWLHHPGLDLAGLSVTIPHKENALRYLQELATKAGGHPTLRGNGETMGLEVQIEPLAESIGAVNTIVVDRVAGETPTSRVPVRLRGFNSDYAAILDSITQAMGIDRTGLAGLHVGVIGAGGTGRTAVAALAHCGASVTIYNRTLERAKELAIEFDGRTGPVSAESMENLAGTEQDIVIQTTSVGMHPKTDASAFDGNMPRLSSRTLVFDAVYNPGQTKLLRQAEEAGAKTVSGVEMFVRQAARQFELWTDKPAPRDLMRQVVLDRLPR